MPEIIAACEKTFNRWSVEHLEDRIDVLQEDIVELLEDWGRRVCQRAGHDEYRSWRTYHEVVIWCGSLVWRCSGRGWRLFVVGWILLEGISKRLYFIDQGRPKGATYVLSNTWRWCIMFFFWGFRLFGRDGCGHFILL